MPAATDRAALSAVTSKEYAKLCAVLENVPDALAMVKDTDDTSIKVVVAHWVGLFLGQHAQGLAGEPVAIPAPGSKWNDLKRYNADLRVAQAGLDWAGARAMLEAEAARLVAFLDSQSDVALYGGPKPLPICGEVYQGAGEGRVGGCLAKGRRRGEPRPTQLGQPFGKRVGRTLAHHAFLPSPSP